MNFCFFSFSLPFRAIDICCNLSVVAVDCLDKRVVLDFILIFVIIYLFDNLCLWNPSMCQSFICGIGPLVSSSAFHHRVWSLKAFMLLLPKARSKELSTLEMGEAIFAQLWSLEVVTLWCPGRTILSGTSFAVTRRSKQKCMNGALQRGLRRFYFILSTQPPSKQKIFKYWFQSSKLIWMQFAEIVGLAMKHFYKMNVLSG